MHDLEDPFSRHYRPAFVSCTLPEVFGMVRPGERIFFDDGKIGGVVRSVWPDHLRVEITQGREKGERLRSDKGINLPDSTLDLPALTPKDVDDLAFVARRADLVGLSFVQRATDVEAPAGAPPGRARPGDAPPMAAPAGAVGTGSSAAATSSS